MHDDEAPRWILALLLSLMTAWIAAPAAAQPSVSERAVVDFVRERLPAVRGTVVEAGPDGIFVDLEGEPRALRVTVYRREVMVEDGRRRLSERTLGRARLVPAGERLARLRADTSLRGAIRQGDRVAWRADPLWLVGAPAATSKSLARSLAALGAVGNVRVVAAGQDRPSAIRRGSIVLRFRTDEIVLRRIGELGVLGRLSRMQPPASDSPRRPIRSGPAEPSLRSAAVFKRRVYDFDWVRVPGRSNVRIIVLGGNNTLGLARWEEGPSRMHWHQVMGKVVSLDVLARRADDLRALPILVVTRRQKDLKSHLYHYDMVERELTRRWSAPRIWMQAAGDSVHAQTMGMSNPFDGSVYPVRLRSDGWNWGSDPDPAYRACDRLPDCRPWNGRLLSLNANGRLTLYRGEDRQGRAGGSFGQSPLWVAAQRGRKKADLNPRYTAWATGEGSGAVLLPHNRYTGTGIIRAMRSFEEATLRLLGVSDGRFEERWESDRRSGFFTRVRGGPSDPWATLVNQDSWHTTLFQVRGTDYPGWASSNAGR